MKSIKKSILGLAMLTAGLVSAQNAEMTNMLKVGANVGVAVPSSNASARCSLSEFSNSRFWVGYCNGL